MELIKSLVKAEFALFNVNEKKCPINGNGNGLDKWETLSVAELVKHHNYNLKLWGMRMGLQENGRRIMSLDFDCCGKSNKEKTERMGCQYTKDKLNEYFGLVDFKDGMYSSSTNGNMNVLIDYTNTKDIIDMVEQMGTNKFNLNGLEILLGGNQVIPPIATICKITQQKGQPRTFLTDKSFYNLTVQSSIYKFVESLFLDKLKGKPKIIKTKTDDTTSEELSDTESIKSNSSQKENKYIILLNDVIGNNIGLDGCKIITRDQWFQICGILKYNGYNKTDWLKYSALISKTQTASKLWDSVKNTTPMNIRGLQNIAKDVNPIRYKSWLNKYEVNLYNPLFSSALIADYFKLLYKEKFVCVNDIVYSYNGIFWEKEDKKNSNLIKFIDKQFIIDLLQYANGKMAYFTSQLSNGINEEITKSNIGKVTELLKNINSIRKVCVRKSIIDDIITFVTNNNVEFDSNPYLFAFNNCVYDLKLGEFVTAKFDFWISKSTGYNYKKSTVTSRDTLDKLVDTIFPNPEIKEDYLTILSTGLSGFQMENCFIATGGGGNGKSLINSLMMRTVGTYGYKLPSNVLLQEIKQGPNAEMANLHNIRFALVQEPNAERKINCSALKELTGDKTLNVRDLYSSKCGINLKLSLVMECNDLPLLNEVNDAINRRLRVSLFQSKFVSKSDYDALDIDDRVNVFIGNPYYKTDDFQDEYKNVLFDILCDKFKVFRDNKFILADMPKPCIDKARDYLATSDNIFSWFSNCYERTYTMEKSEPIFLSAVYDKFSISEYYRDMNKNDKRKYSRKHFCEKIDSNLFMRKYLKLKNTYHNKIQIKGNYIVGWREIEAGIETEN
jgi:phage/plasmid-associated DNA primase